MDINNTAIERARVPVDLTHQFKANYSYDLPFGEGHRIHGRFWDKIIGGWMTSGNITWTSGNPFSIYSGLGTFLSSGQACLRCGTTTTKRSRSRTMSQLNNQIDFRMTGNGPYIVPASAIGSDGRGVAPLGSLPSAAQLFYNPGPGQLGTLQKRVFDGPPIFNMDAKLAKTDQDQRARLRAVVHGGAERVQSSELLGQRPGHQLAAVRQGHHHDGLRAATDPARDQDRVLALSPGHDRFREGPCESFALRAMLEVFAGGTTQYSYDLSFRQRLQ